jgi:hypothetical protein
VVISRSDVAVGNGRLILCHALRRRRVLNDWKLHSVSCASSYRAFVEDHRARLRSRAPTGANRHRERRERSANRRTSPPASCPTRATGRSPRCQRRLVCSLGHRDLVNAAAGHDPFGGLAGDFVDVVVVRVVVQHGRARGFCDRGDEQIGQLCSAVSSAVRELSLHL